MGVSVLQYGKDSAKQKRVTVVRYYSKAYDKEKPAEYAQYSAQEVSVISF